MGDVKRCYSRWTINRRIRRERDRLRVLDEKYASCWVKEDPIKPSASVQAAEISHEPTASGSNVAVSASISTSITGSGAVEDSTSSVYHEAWGYERRAKRESDSTSPDATYAVLPSHKKRNKRIRLLSSSDSEVSQDGPPRTIHVNRLFSYSPMKKLNVVNSTLLHTDVDQSEKENIPLTLSPSTSYTSNDSSTEDLDRQVRRLMHRFDNQMMHLREAISLMDDRMIRMEATLNKIWSHLSCVSSVPSRGDLSKIICNKIRDVFPLTSLEALQKFQEELQSPAYLEHTTHVLSKIHRGRTVAECVRKVCAFVFGNQVSGEVNWLGVNNKARLMGTPLCEAIVSAVRGEHNYPSELEENIHHFIKRWLQGAKDRNGGRTARWMMKETTAMVSRTHGGPGRVEEKKLTLFTQCAKYICLFRKLFFAFVWCNDDLHLFSLQRGLRGD